MRPLVIGFADALIPLGIAVLLLLFPQWFTKADIRIEENRYVAKRLKKIGWLVLAAGMLSLLVNIAQAVSKN